MRLSRYLLAALLVLLLFAPSVIADDEKGKAPAKVCIIEWGVREKGSDAEFAPFLKTSKEGVEIERGIRARIENMPVKDFAALMEQWGLKVKVSGDYTNEQEINFDTRGRFGALAKFMDVIGILNGLLIRQSEDGTWAITLLPDIAELLAKTPKDLVLKIEPVTPEKGIETGTVMICGRYIKPPYKVEVREDGVFINNVPAYPCPGYPASEIKLTPEQKARSEAQYKAGQSIWAKAREIAQTEPDDEELARKLGEFAKTLDYIEDVQVEGTAIKVRFKGEKYWHSFWLSGLREAMAREKKTPEEIAAERKEEFLKWKERTERRLQGGGGLLIFPGVDRSGTPLAAIIKDLQQMEELGAERKMDVKFGELTKELNAIRRCFEQGESAIATGINPKEAAIIYANWKSDEK